MKRIAVIIFLPAMVILLAAYTRQDPVFPADVKKELDLIKGKLDYNFHIKPILSDKCFKCHGPDKAKQKAGLRLDHSASAFGMLPQTPGKVAIRPGDILNSELVNRILSTEPYEMMPEPSSNLSLTAKEKAYLIKWIQQGAEYKPHWAFVAPEKKSVPELEGVYASAHPVDAFIREKLSEHALLPARQAAKDILLRRLSLDLTGLPPTVAELDQFLSDTSAQAYEKQVDRLLASPHYGERMATDWLDLARFADSHGYSVDRLRDMSPYRDWVINAFNRNMPYSRFIEEQLAGDLMPHPSKDMIIATAFNRLHQQNMEGGVVEEEFQAEYVIDRTNTFGQAFMALTINCARCHDHKFDPVSQKEFYQLSSFFNNVREAGQIAWNDDMPTPTLLLPTEKEQQTMDHIRRMVSEQEKAIISVMQSRENLAERWIETGAYRQIKGAELLQRGLTARYALDGDLFNALDTARRGAMKHDAGATGDIPVFTSVQGRTAIQLNGDVYLDLKDAGVFGSADPFSIGMWIWIPAAMKDGVIFHKSDGERLYNYKGYNLSLKDGRFEITMAHTAPSNAIIKSALVPAPREQWVHVTLTYDGAAKADGFQLYQNGEAVAMQVVIDHLYKDILFYRKEEPALQIGGWWRGTGFKGGLVDDIAVFDRALTLAEIKMLSGEATWETLAAKDYPGLSDEEKKMLRRSFIEVIDTASIPAQRKLQAVRRQYWDTIRNVKEIMVMEEMPAPKRSYLLNRGRYDDPGEEVFPGTPSSLLDMPVDLPRNRLGLSQWLIHPAHPLTARVMVNRLWQQCFGNGLVKTSEDFGNQGEIPSHPELLDWLAVNFRESGWDIKKLLKLIVMSETYRQDSYTAPQLAEADPENRLLARGPSGRLTAEMIRDNALAACGMINKKIGGRSIFPYQPEGLWEINSMAYPQDTTDELYRRGVYVIVKRSVPHPSLGIFDAPERSSCMSRRQKTASPSQALVIMNDPTYIEAARVLAHSVAVLKDPGQQIQLMYRRLTARTPSASEMTVLRELQERQLSKFRADPGRMKGWMEAGMYKVKKGEDLPAIAANTVVASAIMNSDATLTKR